MCVSGIAGSLFMTGQKLFPIYLMKSKFLSQIYSTIAILAVFHSSCFAENISPRERLLLDAGWKFYLGNPWGEVISLAKAGDNGGPTKPAFSDAGWRTVDLPHDWAVELSFDPGADCNHGFKPVGPNFERNDIAWYRRSFELSQHDSGKRFWLEFDGVFRNCDVFVNGWFVGHHDDGYQGFRYDITDLAHCGGKNVVSVKVDASQFEGWFYEGAGIYRHVWLEKTSPLAIVPDGIFVSSQFPNNIPKGVAKINVEADLSNILTNAAQAKVTCEIVSPEGGAVTKFAASAVVSNQGQQTVRLAGKVSTPVLWSPELPKLYKLITTVESDGQVVDRKETEFGIRTVAYDPNQGFLLNGQHYEVKGTCNHQDAAGVGVALPDALQYFRIAKLKEMGCNAYRTSHNAPTPELLEACDRLGMLVLDENRLFGSDAVNLERLKEQIIRDRNHPSVFTWSLGNEEWSAQDTATGAAVTRAMQNLAHSLDPTRPCTMAVNSGSYGDFGIFSALDVKGFNYHYESMDAYHAAFPNADILGTEQASSIGTRGIYTNDASLGYISAYDDHNPRWGCSAEEWWGYFATRPWASGGFDWTGFDYRGEPTPYQWPCISSHFGILDTCGFPKDNFWYYQSWWTTNIVLHLLPHWNWPGREGQDISVRALSNCQEVELFLNGQSLGRLTMKPNSELKWNVKYEPGVLSAKGYNDGKLVAETKVETTGEPAAISLAPDRSTINADGEDISVITVAINDAQDRTVPLANNLIHFDLSGPGKIIGVGNGNPTCHEPDIFVAKPNVEVIPVNDGWRYKIMPDVRDSQLPELQPGFDNSGWDAVNTRGNANALKEPEQAIFCTKVSLSPDELAAEGVQLKIGRIDDRGWVYVNGKYAGESRDWSSSPSFNIKALLHAGENTIAIAVINSDGSGGLGNNIALKLFKKVEVPKWQRSAFNGLAQVLVQSTGQPGEIKLKATAEGLRSAFVLIQSNESTQRKFTETDGAYGWNGKSVPGFVARMNN
jgi:beta-galactosidase